MQDIDNKEKHPGSKGYVWITNGESQKTIPKTKEVPDGWRYGRLKFSLQTRQTLSKTHIGHKVITDGINERHIKANEEIPSGWVLGKSDATKKKMSQACIGRFNITNGTEMKHTRTLDNIPDGWYRGNVNVSEETCKKLSITSSSEHKKQTEYETKCRNNSFTKSNPENKYYQYLISKYGESDIIRQYRDERYPFNCDFYIKSEDLFIECNFHWTHGGHPFDETSESDIERMNKWKSRISQSKFYKQAVYVWCDLDVRKQQIATQNNLNYQAIYKF